MLVANTFDQWQSDTFFSAAEEVQQSADLMESAYRTWITERREGAEAESLDEFSRDLQMALGTAKWQLEEFERAVRLSYKNHADNITITRHGQFVSAIEDQICRVEAALKEAFNMEGKKPLQWVNLDEKERDDLALFLSGSSRKPQCTKDESASMEKGSNCSVRIYPKYDEIKDQTSSSNDIAVSNLGSHHLAELEGLGTPQLRHNVDCQSDYRTSNHRTWNTSDISKFEIVVDQKDKLDASLSGTESTYKEKDQSMSPKDLQKGKQHPHILSVRTNWINQLSGRISSRPRQLQILSLKPIQTMLLLMLTIFLVVPFLLYSN